MKILIVSQHYFPDPFSITTIAEYLVKKGHDVTVLTGKPNYGYYRIVPGYEHLDYEILNGVNPRKWICVEAEQINVIFKDNVVVLVMTDKDLATSITNAVKTKLNVTDANVLEKENVDGDYELPPEMIVTQ